VAGVKAITTRRGEPMAFLTVADGVDQLEAVLFPAVYQGCRDLLEEGQPLLVAGQARTRTTSGGEELQLEARWVAPLTPQGLCLEVEAGGGLDWTERLAALLRGRRGSVPVWLLVEGEQERALILLPRSLWLADGESGRMAERLAAMEGIPVRTARTLGEERARAGGTGCRKRPSRPWRDGVSSWRSWPGWSSRWSRSRGWTSPWPSAGTIWRRCWRSGRSSTPSLPG